MKSVIIPIVAAKVAMCSEVIMAIFEAATTGITVRLPQTKRTHPLLEFAGVGNLSDLPAVTRPYAEWMMVVDQRIAKKGVDSEATRAREPKLPRGDFGTIQR